MKTITAIQNKAKNLQANTQIRLSADVNSYWLFNLKGVLYIGIRKNDNCELPRYFENRYVVTVEIKNDSIYYLQQL